MVSIEVLNEFYDDDDIIAYITSHDLKALLRNIISYKKKASFTDFSEFLDDVFEILR